MSHHLLYLETHSTNPFFNLAFEEVVLSGKTHGDYLLLWQNHNTVVVGANQNTLQEIHPDFVREHRISVVRRNTGGGAVYHDMGNLNYSFITDTDNRETVSFAKFTTPVAEALRSLGLDAKVSGRNDILIGDRKISGTAQQILKGRILHHGTLLFDTNPEMMMGALRPNPLKYQSRGTQSVESRVGNIKDFLKSPMSLTAFWQYLKDYLTKDGMTKTCLSETELTEVQTLCDDKYSSWEWNYGRSPGYNVRHARKWPRGILEIYLDVKKGHIAGIRIYGDFLSTSPIAEAEKALLGQPLERDRLLAVLNALPLDSLFGGLSSGEIVSTLME